MNVVSVLYTISFKNIILCRGQISICTAIDKKAALRIARYGKLKIYIYLPVGIYMASVRLFFANGWEHCHQMSLKVISRIWSFGINNTAFLSHRAENLLLCSKEMEQFSILTWIFSFLLIPFPQYSKSTKSGFFIWWLHCMLGVVSLLSCGTIHIDHLSKKKLTFQPLGMKRPKATKSWICICF